MPIRGRSELRSVFNSIHDVPFRDVILGIFLWTLSLMAVFGLLALMYLTIAQPIKLQFGTSANNAQPVVNVHQRTSYPTTSVPGPAALAYPFSNGGYAESWESAQADPRDNQEAMEDL